MRQQRFAPLGLADLAGAGQQGFEIAIFLDQLGGRLDADTRNARNVVDGVAGQRLHIDDPIRCDTELLLHFVRPDGAVVDRVEHDDPRTDELHQVLVRGDDGHFRTRLARNAGVGGDQVVRLPAVALDAGHLEGPHRFTDQGELWHQFVRRRRPMRLVFGENIVAEGPPAGVEDHRQMVGLGFLQQLDQHVDKAENGIDGRAIRPRQRRQLVERPKDKAGAVDQKNVARRRGRSLRHFGRRLIRGTGQWPCAG